MIDSDLTILYQVAGSDSHTKEVCQSDDIFSNSSLSHSGLQSLIPDAFSLYWRWHNE